jgi:trimeric autotransporter adhesin
MRTPRAALAVLGLGVLAAAAQFARAEQVIAVTVDDRLITFDTATPQSVASARVLSGFDGHVVAVDVRPANGLLYGLTDTGRLYRIDIATGVGTQIGAGPISPTLFGTSVGMDFDPTTDRIRVVTDANQNLRLNPDDGSVVDGNPTTVGTQIDADFRYGDGDLFGFRLPHVVEIAHESSESGTTIAYVIDSNLDIVARLGDPDASETTRNAGVLHTIGPLGVNSLGLVGFDISRATGEAFATLTLAGEATSKLHRVSLVTGAAILVGQVGDLQPVRSMTLGPGNGTLTTPHRVLIGLTAGGELVTFASDRPQTILDRVTVTGLVAGDPLVAIATRPSNGRLYGVSREGRLYVINARTGVATLISTTPLDVDLTGGVAMTFNASGDRLRIITDTGLNFRVAPDTGLVLDTNATLAGTQIDEPFAFATGDLNELQTPFLGATTLARSSVTSPFSLFAIDTSLDSLVRLGSPGGTPITANTGIVSTVGSLGVDATSVLGFTAVGGVGFATIVEPGGTSRLFQIDLSTGATAPVAFVGTGETIISLAVAPRSNPPAPGDPLRIGAMVVRLDFTRPDHDSAVVVGSIPFPGPLANRSVVVDVGGFTKSFVLNRIGKRRDNAGTKALNDDDVFAFVGGPRDGRIGFVLTLRRENLQAALADEGLTDSDIRRQTRVVHVIVTVDGVPYATDVSLRYSARAGRSGTALKP